ncbi:hypothetical protein BpHYR1_049014 [Brachionus plicatilis]|uniref:Uncharacterized protein n=1 Tax=Brachionus plicatilis TaxID=10195 RepID=A0A3M7RHD4_BRAPC|nr:hypothetical protein BpHYR1_049014 [Brachionus plicatilis]
MYKFKSKIIWVCHSKEETMVLSLTQISDSNFNNTVSTYTKMMYLNSKIIYRANLKLEIKN